MAPATRPPTGRPGAWLPQLGEALRSQLPRGTGDTPPRTRPAADRRAGRGRPLRSAWLAGREPRCPLSQGAGRRVSTGDADPADDHVAAAAGERALPGRGLGPCSSLRTRARRSAARGPRAPCAPRAEPGVWPGLAPPQMEETHQLPGLPSVLVSPGRPPSPTGRRGLRCSRPGADRSCPSHP